MYDEVIVRKLENVKSMILVIQNDITNVEGSSQEETLSDTLNIMYDYIGTIATEVAKKRRKCKT